MPIISDCQQARSEITSFEKLNNDSFAFSTKYHGAKIIDSQNCDIKLSFKNTNLNFNTTAICFSPNSKLIAFATNTHLYIANMYDKKILQSIELDKNIINILTFDPSSQYIIAGNSDGRVLLFKHNASSQLSRLCSFPYQRPKSKIKKNFISAFAFYKNLLAVSGYGGAIFIIDISSFANKTVLIHSTAAKRSLCFLNENNIVSADNDGNLQFISIADNKVIKNITLPVRKISQITLIPKSKYLIINANTTFMIIVDYKEYKIIHNKYIEFKDNIYKVFAIDASALVVCLKNKEIKYIELPSAKRLSSLILQNDLPEAHALIDREPMLLGTKEHRNLEKIYDTAYKNAAGALVNQQPTVAKEFMQIYKEVASKKESIVLLFKSFEHYNRFKTLYVEKKHALGFAMSAKYPALKLTQQYKNMEIRWKETFTNAQRHILLGKTEYAKALFQDYITVASKRPIIELILRHNSLFIQFLKALEKQDFKQVHEICMKNPLFTQMPIYKTLSNDIEKSIIRIEAYIKKNNISLARTSLSKIEMTSGFKDKVEQLYSMCDDMIQLQEMYAKGDFYSCYELIDLYKHLHFSDLGELLQKHYTKLIDECEVHALKGNIQGIKAVLGDLITLDARKEKVGDLLRVSFLMQIKYFLSNKKSKAAKSVIYTYIDLFTKDVEIIDLMKKYENQTHEKLAITLSSEETPSRDAWLNSSIIFDS